MTPKSVELNHVLIYTKDIACSLRFYRDLLGLRLIEHMDGYARLKSKGNSTVALHKISGGAKPEPKRSGIRLYFEAIDLDRLCKHLKSKGVSFEQMPKDMPWGWRHAYLFDPDGYPISLYRAGRKRMQKTV